MEEGAHRLAGIERPADEVERLVEAVAELGCDHIVVEGLGRVKNPLRQSEDKIPLVHPFRDFDEISDELCHR